MKRLTTEEFIIKAKQVHEDKYGYDQVEYKTSQDKVKIYCPGCNKYFYQRPNGHLRGKGCEYCGRRVGKFSTEEFIRKSKIIHGDKYGYDKVKYQNIRTKIKVYCKRCVKYFETIPQSHLKGHNCPECSIRNRKDKNKELNIRPWNYKDLSGRIFGRLKVVKEYTLYKTDKIYWFCKCECNTTKIISSSGLLHKGTKSCGCLQREKTSKAVTKHGMCHTSEYNAWANMKKRCYNKSDKRYPTYGARGIKICDRWLGEDGFINFINDMGLKPSKKLTLDRVDNDKDYTPDNCRWDTIEIQSRKKTTSRILSLHGEEHNLEDWGNITGYGKKTIWNRLNSGWSVEDALTKPVKGRK